MGTRDRARGKNKNAPTGVGAQFLTFLVY